VPTPISLLLAILAVAAAVADAELIAVLAIGAAAVVIEVVIAGFSAVVEE
jgi:hypothetical protein